MKWKKILRSVLAVVCSASLVLGLIGVIPETVSATDAATLPAYVPEGFTLVTPESFGIEDYNNNTEVAYKQNTLSPITKVDKMAFNGTICMNYGNGMYYMSSSPDATDGIVMWVNNGSSGVRLYNRFTNEAFYLGDVFASATQTTYSYADLRPFAGTETLVAGTEILYTITTEVIDYDGDNGVDDIKLGVWFNHVLYNNAYFYIKDGLQSGFVNFKTNAFSCSSPEAPSTTPTPPEFDEVTFEDFGIDDGTYGYTPWIAPNGTPYRSPSSQGSNAGGIKDKTFVGKVNFTSQSRTCITFGGKNDGSTGFCIGTWVDGRLSYWDGEWKIGDPVYFSTDGAAGVIGSTQEIKISFEVFDKDADGEDDIRVWFYFGDTLYGDGPLCELTDYAGELGNYVGTMTYGDTASTVTVASVKEQAPTPPTFTEVTFSDFGVDNGTYGDVADLVVEETYSGGLANKTFVGKVNFSSASRLSINFGGDESGWEGVALGTWTDGRIWFWEQEGRFDHMTIAAASTTGVIDASQTIKLSFEVVDLKNDGVDDVRFWLYFGDTLYGDGPLYVAEDYAQYLGNYLGIRAYNAGTTVTVKSASSTEPPELDEITFSDFGVDNGTYGDVADLVVEETYSGGLANKTFVGKVNFSSASRLSINFGGSDSGWKGVALGTWTDGRIWFWEQEGRFDHMTIAAASTTGVIDASQTIKLSFEVVDLKNDGVDDVRFWLYFGDTLYGDGPLYVAEDYAQYLGNYLGIRAYNAGTTVTVESVSEGSGSITPPGPGPGPGTGEDPEPVTPPTLEEISFSDIGVASGLYGGKADLIVEKTYAGGFANKTFVGKVNFSNKSRLSLNFGGSDSGWKGFSIGTWLDGQLWYWWGDADTIVPYTALSSDANALIGEGATLKISFEVTDIDNDSSQDDVRIWLYIGDTLYNNGPLIEKADYAQYLGNYFGLRCFNTETSVVIASKDEDTGAGATPTEPTLEDITFSDFKVDDGSYGYTGAGDELAVDKTYKESFLDKRFVGIAKFPKAAVTRLNLGGKGSSWKGVQLTTLGSSIYFAEAEDHFTAVALDETVVEGGLRGENITYKIAFEVADTDNDGLKDDVRFWLYIGDQLYKNAPIVEAANYVHFVGNGLGIFSNNQEADVIIASADLGRPVVKEPTVPEITFSDFEIEDGTYSKEEHNGCAAVGSYREGFKNKTFVGTVNFNGTPLASIQFGGSDSEWKGVRLMVLSDGNLYFMESEGLFGNIKLSKTIAGCELIGVPLKIKLTVEVTDLDNDGEQDDVRYWLTLGDKLYNDEPIMEAIDYAHKVGNRMGIYASDEAATVTVTSAKLDRPAVVVDFGEMGFTNNWQKEISATKRGGISFGQSSNTIYTGDISYIGFYMIICIAALSGICFVSYKKRH